VDSVSPHPKKLKNERERRNYSVIFLEGLRKVTNYLSYYSQFSDGDYDEFKSSLRNVFENLRIMDSVWKNAEDSVWTSNGARILENQN
jgi:hypothetical protein